MRGRQAFLADAARVTVNGVVVRLTVDQLRKLRLDFKKQNILFAFIIFQMVKHYFRLRILRQWTFVTLILT